MSRNNLQWTTERDDMLRKMWADPELTISEISERLGGSTRSAICGRAARIDLPTRNGQKRGLYRGTNWLVEQHGARDGSTGRVTEIERAEFAGRICDSLMVFGRNLERYPDAE